MAWGAGLAGVQRLPACTPDASTAQDLCLPVASLAQRSGTPRDALHRPPQLGPALRVTWGWSCVYMGAPVFLETAQWEGTGHSHRHLEQGIWTSGLASKKPRAVALPVVLVCSPQGWPAITSLVSAPSTAMVPWALSFSALPWVGGSREAPVGPGSAH